MEIVYFANIGKILELFGSIGKLLGKYLEFLKNIGNTGIGNIKKYLGKTCSMVWEIIIYPQSSILFIISQNKNSKHAFENII